MIAHWDIIQGTEEWHKIRYAKIGGSTSKGLFVNSDTLLDEVLSELLEDYQYDDDDYISKDMQRGNELEPYARKEAILYTGIEFKECGWMQSSINELLGISPDGITNDFKKSVEIKCPSAKKHTSTIRIGEIPSDNIHQCLHYFTVNEYLEEHYFVSFRPESVKPLFVKKLTRDSLIDLGTKAKPNVKKISEWVDIALKNADELLKLTKEEVRKINGI